MLFRMSGKGSIFCAIEQRKKAKNMLMGAETASYGMLSREKGVV